jgi:hypothetical protein
MSKLIRASLISFSLALIICFSDHITNLNELISIILITQAMGLGLFCVLKLIDILILDRIDISSNIIRVLSYMLTGLVYTNLFVFMYWKSFVDKLPAEKIVNDLYTNHLLIRAFAAGFLYLIYGVLVFLLLEWMGNKIKLKRFNGL